MARPQGASIFADLTGCKPLDPNCVSTCIGAGLLCLYFKSKPDNISFLSIQVAGISRVPSGGNPTMSSSVLTETLLYPCGFFLFPVCSLRWGIIQHFLSKRSRCHQTTLLVAHWPNSTAPEGPALQLLQLTLLSPPFITWRVVVFSVCCFSCSNTVFVNGSETGALPLCYLQQWSARRIWLSSVRAFYAEVKTEGLHVRNALRFTKINGYPFVFLNVCLLCL